MSKIRQGNKQNATINGEWGKHVRKFFKKFTSGKRRARERKNIENRLNSDSE